MSTKIGIVIQREYLSRVRKKSFLLMTILMPVIFVLLMFVPLWLSDIKDDTVKRIDLLDQTGKYIDLFKDIEGYDFVPVDQSLPVVKDDKGYATLVISSDLLENPSAIVLYSDRQVTADLTNAITHKLDNYLQDEKLASYQIPHLKEIIEESKVNVKLQTVKLSEDGSEKESSAALASVIGIVFTVIIYMFIFAYGGMVMRGVTEEKTNRIIEVMVSSVKPFDLMMGKIIGVGLVGLTQFLIWALLIGGLSTVGGLIWGTVSMAANPMAGTPELPPSVMNNIFTLLSSINVGEIVFYFFVFFIGGYMLYASLFAAIASAVDSQEDTQQFMLPITMFILFAFYAAIYGMKNPDGPLAFWTSIIPFTSPIVMMVRLPFDVPLWQKLLSVALLYVTFFFIIRFSAKIYRVGILMYGKKPSLKEMFKWLKYKV